MTVNRAKAALEAVRGSETTKPELAVDRALARN